MSLRPADSASSSIEGITVLVVEDETMIAFLIEDMLKELGCARVLHAGRVNDALTLLRQHRPHAAVLDINLAGEMAYPVAVQLAKAGVPFVFASGYGRSGVPSEWASQPVVQKPFSTSALAAALRSVMASPAAS